ncbi:MAG: alkaline phosphatase family protein [Acidobacteria bacterium]|nr:alkaline phosphatase family protein [Acidobacteriota bacterium]
MKIRPGYVKRVLGGAVFGLYVGLLIPFLNPQIEARPSVIAPMVIAYAAIWGLLLGSLLWLLRIVRVRVIGRPGGEFRPHGFGYVVVATFGSAALYWMHLAVLRIYLPPGAIRVLSKASILVGVTAFVLFAVWLVERNADARASNGLVALALGVIALSAVMLYYRRAQYFERPPQPRRAPVRAMPTAKVTIVTIRSLSYDWLVTAAGEEATPALHALRDRSYLTRLTPFNSSSPRALWASLATGKLPNRHGVTGRYSYRTLLNRDEPWLNIPIGVAFPSWGLIPPVEKIAAPLPSGRSLPLWSILTRSGAPAVVVNWPASHGSLPEGVRGASDQICRSGSAAQAGDRTRVQGACVEAAPRARELTVRDTRFDERTRRRIRRALTSDRASARVAIALANESAVPLTVVSLNQVEETARAIGQKGNALPAAATPHGDALRLALEQVDALVREIDRGIEGDILIVVSPSGFDPPDIPSSPMGALSLLSASMLSPGSDEGFMLLASDQGVASANPAAVRVVDLVPTVLYAIGMPIARDLDGRVLTEALGEEIVTDRSAQYIQTYDVEPTAPP